MGMKSEEWVNGCVVINILPSMLPKDASIEKMSQDFLWMNGLRLLNLICAQGLDYLAQGVFGFTVPFALFHHKMEKSMIQSIKVVSYGHLIMWTRLK